MKSSKEQIAKLLDVIQSDETWELDIRKARTWVERKKGDIYRPYQLIVVSKEGLILGSKFFETYPSNEAVRIELARWMRRPIARVGAPRRPQKIHLATPDLADSLRPWLEQADIGIQLVEQLPSFERVFEKMSEKLAQNNPKSLGFWKMTGMTEALARRLYDLTADFYTLAPWKLLPDEVVFEVSNSLSSDPRYALVIGMQGEDFGIVVADRLEDLGEMWDTSRHKKRSGFTYILLSFVTPVYLPFEDLDAAEQYEWRLAGDKQYPWILRVGGEHELAQASLADMLWVEGAFSAINQYFAKDFKPGLDGLPARVERTYPVETQSGEGQVTIRGPVWPEGFSPEESTTLLTPKEYDKANRALVKGEKQINGNDPKGALRTYLGLLKWLPEDRDLMKTTWANLGVVYSIMEDYGQAFQAFTNALKYGPDEGQLWFNRASAAVYSLRNGQAMLDLENAVKVEKDESQLRKYQGLLDLARRMVRDDLSIREPGFSVEQLIEQQEAFYQGVQQISAERWEEAEQSMRKTIAIADVSPQPNGCLGVALMMQRRLDEAEAAFGRALEIDPEDQFVHKNLEMLNQFRKSGEYSKARSSVTPLSE